MKFDHSTIRDSPSPKFLRGGSQEAKCDHPRQKPVSLMQRPIRNHTRRGIGIRPVSRQRHHAGRGGTNRRVCHGLDPKYVNVIVERWKALTVRQAVPEGNGRAFGEIRQEPARRLLLTPMIARNLRICNPMQMQGRRNG